MLHGPASERSPEPVGGRRVRDLWLGWLFVATQFLLLGVLLREVWNGGRAALLWLMIGGVLVAVGAAIAGLGSRRLGRELRTHPAPSDMAVLRTDGAYRFVRHPIYTGVLLLASGFAVVAGTVLAAVTFVALVVLLSLKARFEERLLADRFPGYREYARRTPRFVPRLPGLQRRG